MNDTSQLKLSKIRISSFLQELKIIGSAYPKNGFVEIIFEFANDLPEFIYAERTSLQQIVINLLSNSVKFTERGFIKLSCLKNNNYVQFICEDTGPGMSPQFMKEKLFTPFSQENTIKIDRPKGLGLGLSLSKRLIEKMKGSLEVESHQGIGTKMVLSLPILPSGFLNVTEQSSPSRMIELIAPNPEILSSEFPLNMNFQKVVLVIDDNSLNRQILSKLLKINNFCCIEASGGNEALHILSQNQNQIHVILLDMFMPIMNGIETGLKIKELTKTWKIPPLIIGCSADNSTETQKQFLELGVAHFLNKPITSLNISTIHKLFQQHYQQHCHLPNS